MDLIAIPTTVETKRLWHEIDCGLTTNTEWETLKRSNHVNAIEFFRKHKNDRHLDFIYLEIVGNPTTLEEKIVHRFLLPNLCGKQMECTYEDFSDAFPEDFTEGRTDWYHLKEYADDMKYFIQDLFDTI